MRGKQLTSLGGLLICLSLLTGCLALSSHEPTATPRTQPISLRDLLLDVSAFPGEWYVDPTQRTSPEMTKRIHPWAQESQLRAFRVRGYDGLAVHEVIRYKESRDASLSFDAESSSEFHRTTLQVTRWKIPDELPYQSSAADQFTLACSLQDKGIGTGEQITICVAIGRYDEFLSEFSTWVDPNYMTYVDLERVLRVIDQRMAHYVRGKQEKRP